MNMRNIAAALFLFGGIGGIVAGISRENYGLFGIGASCALLGTIGIIFHNDPKRIERIRKRFLQMAFGVAVFISAISLVQRISETRSVAPPINDGRPSTAIFYVPKRIKIWSDLAFGEEGVVVIVKAQNSKRTIDNETRYPQSPTVWKLAKGEYLELRPEIRIPAEDDVQVQVMVVAMPTASSEEAVNFLRAFLGETASAFAPGGALLKGVSNEALSRVTEGAKDALTKGRWIGYLKTSIREIANGSLLSSTSGREFEVFWAKESSLANKEFVPVFPPLTDTQPNTSIPPNNFRPTERSGASGNGAVEVSYVISPTVRCPRTESCISSPEFDVTLTAAAPTVIVTGTAIRNNFLYYKLELESPLCGGGYCLLMSSNESVSRGRLAVIDLRKHPGLTTGDYWIRLVVVDTSGNSYPESARFHINIR